jgi:hypothetical protein
VSRNTSGGKYEEVQVIIDEEENYIKEKQWVEFKEDKNDFTCDFFLPTNFIGNEKYACAKENELKHFNDDYAYWHKSVVLAPETLNFWIEFLDDAGELEAYSIPHIGARAKSINNNKVSAIYFRETPNIIFTTKDTYDPDNLQSGYVYILLQPYIENAFTISSQGKSAKDEIDELLYNHTYCSESITL